MLNSIGVRLAQSDIDCQTSFSEDCWRRICSNDMGENAQGDGSVVASVCDLENLLSHPDPDPTALIASLHPSDLPSDSALPQRTQEKTCGKNYSRDTSFGKASPCTDASITKDLDILRMEEDSGALNCKDDGDDGSEMGWRNWCAIDDVKGGELPPHLVHKARMQEFAYLKNRGVYRYASISQAIKSVGRRPSD